MRLLIALLAAVAAFALVSAVLDRHDSRPVRGRKEGGSKRSGLQQRLDQSGAGISAGRYRLTVIGTMVGVALVIVAATGTLSLAVPSALAIVSKAAPRCFNFAVGRSPRFSAGVHLPVELSRVPMPHGSIPPQAMRVRAARASRRWGIASA